MSTAQLEALQGKDLIEFATGIQQTCKTLVYESLRGNESAIRESLKQFRELREQQLPKLAELRATYWAYRNDNGVYAALEQAIIALNFAVGANFQHELAQNLYNIRQPLDSQNKMRYERIITLFKEIAKVDKELTVRPVANTAVIELYQGGKIQGLIHPEWLYDTTHHLYIYQKQNMSIQDAKNMAAVLNPTWRKAIHVYTQAVDLRINLMGGK